MTLLETLKKEKFYAQGVSSVPLYLMACARSGFLMEKELGYGYRFFCHIYNQGYGEILYPVSELDRLWAIIKPKILGEADYLHGIKAKYEKGLVQGESLFNQMQSMNLQLLSDQELFGTFKQCLEAQTATVGLAHAIEPVGFGLDEELKQKLDETIKDKKVINAAYANLTKPSQQSFLSKEQDELEVLLDLQGMELEQAVEDHLNKYYWLLCNYAGLRQITKEHLVERLGVIRPSHKPGLKSEEVLSADGLDKDIKNIVKLIDFVTIWQDERKAHILKAIYHLGCVVEELSRRSDMTAELINYLEPTEVLSLNSLEQLQKMSAKLAQRVNGVFFLQLPEGPDCAVGDGYQTALRIYNQVNGGGSSKPASSAIYGAVANTGTAVGPVIICTDLASIDRVKEGDILVASMTRPEYMSAIKKAAAIVTDEGGITCHAAIVARELGIPCVIGTKVATKVFKDGDMVEVKADHGLIRRIN